MERLNAAPESSDDTHLKWKQHCRLHGFVCSNGLRRSLRCQDGQVVVRQPGRTPVAVAVTATTVTAGTARWWRSCPALCCCAGGGALWVQGQHTASGEQLRTAPPHALCHAQRVGKAVEWTAEGCDHQRTLQQVAGLGKRHNAAGGC